MVHGSWFMVHGSWFMVHGSWFMVHGSWFMVHGSWFMVCKNRKSFPVCAVNYKMLVLTLFYMRNEHSEDPVHIPDG
jgi:hypothetical protein